MITLFFSEFESNIATKLIFVFLIFFLYNCIKNLFFLQLDASEDKHIVFERPQACLKGLRQLKIHFTRILFGVSFQNFNLKVNCRF